MARYTKVSIPAKGMIRDGIVMKSREAEKRLIEKIIRMALSTSALRKVLKRKNKGPLFMDENFSNNSA